MQYPFLSSLAGLLAATSFALAQTPAPTNSYTSRADDLASYRPIAAPAAASAAVTAPAPVVVPAPAVVPAADCAGPTICPSLDAMVGRIRNPGFGPPPSICSGGSRAIGFRHWSQLAPPCFRWASSATMAPRFCLATRCCSRGPSRAALHGRHLAGGVPSDRRGRRLFLPRRAVRECVFLLRYHPRPDATVFQCQRGNSVLGVCRFPRN